MTENIYDVWARRNPKFETRMEEAVIRLITDYGVGASEGMSYKGKILGAGYEAYIMAFFIGLYSNKKKALKGEQKGFGQPIQFWGNLDSKKGRKAYPKIREYIFTALVTKTTINWIEVDKGTIKVQQVVDDLITTMEEYANYGFHFMLDKLESDPGFFYNNTSFLDIFLKLTEIAIEQPKVEEPDSLD